MDRTEALNVAIEAVKAASQSTIEAGVFFPSGEKVERLEFFANVLTELRGLRDASPAPAVVVDDGEVTAAPESDGWRLTVQTDSEGNAVSHLLSAAEAASLSAALSPAPADEGREVAVDLLAKACELLGDVPWSGSERYRRWRFTSNNLVTEAEALLAAPLLAAAPSASAVPEERDEARPPLPTGLAWRSCRQCGQPHGLQYVGACLACGNALAARPAPVTAAPTEEEA